MIRLVQIKNPAKGRRVAVVENEQLQLLENVDSIFRLAEGAVAAEKPLAKEISVCRTGESLDYDDIYQGRSEWQLLPAFDHPEEPARCLVTGTGLTHKKSAENRQAMHTDASAPLTDSMRMYHWGVEGGRPAAGKIGAQPEWF